MTIDTFGDEDWFDDEDDWDDALDDWANNNSSDRSYVIDDEDDSHYGADDIFDDMYTETDA